MKRFALLAALCAVAQVQAAPTVDVATYVRKDQFEDIKISPNGLYYAATVPLDDRTALAVIERGTNKVVGSFKLREHTGIHEFSWVTPDRLLISTSEKFGAEERPKLTGDLYAMNADGTKLELLVGQNVYDGGAGTTIKPKKDNDRVAAFMIDAPPAETRTALITAQPYLAVDAPDRDVLTSVQRIDLFNGRMQRVTAVPVRGADFYLDNQGAVRFAAGGGTDNIRRLYYRAADNAEWELLTIEHDGLFEMPIGFSADDKIAYLQTEMPAGPDAIVALDLGSRKRTQVLRDASADPGRIIYRNGTLTPIGAYFMDGKPRTVFFDESAPEARLQKSLEAVFEGDTVVITSQTSDNRLALVEVSSDRNPGDFYLFDTVAKKAGHVLARREWFDPEQQAEMRPIQLAARDGLPLHGFLTIPQGSNGKSMPMVVMPHGGPFGVEDTWGFDSDVQMLAKAGYAVLQVNFRGSGGFGRSFQSAGGREWGGKMQDDLTDATRWASQQGYADPSRICIFGGSYGGYASLMGVAKEPDLYRCAVGYIGVYDLPTMLTQGDVQERGSGEAYLKGWVGEREAVRATSPTQLASRIKVPVFLAAGGADERARSHTAG